MRVKQAKIKDYVPYKGSDGETSSEVEDPSSKLMEDYCKASHLQDDTYSQLGEADLMDQE